MLVYTIECFCNYKIEFWCPLSIPCKFCDYKQQAKGKLSLLNGVSLGASAALQGRPRAKGKLANT